jgi:ribosomal protein L3
MTRGKSSHTRKKTSVPSRQWRVMDLHGHTPASADYQEPVDSNLLGVYGSVPGAKGAVVIVKQARKQ